MSDANKFNESLFFLSLFRVILQKKNQIIIFHWKRQQSGYRKFLHIVLF